jgi:hypothetical protein
MRIHGIEGRKLLDVERDLQAGGRFVFFEYCISLIVVSLRRPSDVYFLRAGKWGWRHSLPYCLISLALGWWGFPWGLIYTPLTLVTNLSGGCDVSPQILDYLRNAQQNEVAATDMAFA